MTQHIESDPQAREPGEHLLQELKWVHNILRQDLALCQELAGQVAAGAVPEYVRGQVKSLQTSSPLWKLRVNCLYYCRFVHAHHHGEDVALFPALRRTNPALGPAVDRLVSDHRKVSSLLDHIETSANALVAQDGIDPRATGSSSQRPVHRPAGAPRLRGGSHRTYTPRMGNVAIRRVRHEIPKWDTFLTA